MLLCRSIRLDEKVDFLSNFFFNMKYIISLMFANSYKLLKPTYLKKAVVLNEVADVKTRPYSNS